jgi:glycosyltransferase involved in cell wall biosynthesis
MSRTSKESLTMKLSIVMPVYNERATILEIIRKVMAAHTACSSRELIIVDDASTDGTKELLKTFLGRADVRVVFHDRNCGKGAAIRTGLEHAGGDLILIQDADLEYDPKDYERLLDPILQDKADVVYGNRFHGEAHRVLYFWHAMGNRILTFISNMITNVNLNDMEVGYKAFRSDVLRKIRLRSDRFGFEPEVTVKMAKLGCRMYEVPISYYGRTYEEGKKITWRDGVEAIWCLLRYKFFD